MWLTYAVLERICSQTSNLQKGSWTWEYNIVLFLSCCFNLIWLCVCTQRYMYSHYKLFILLKITNQETVFYMNWKEKPKRYHHYHHNHQGMLTAWIPLTLLVSPQDSIQCLHRSDVCKFLQISQHWCVHI